MMIITISNQKGGVGKTTIAVQIAARAGERGLKTLVVDLDGQGSASYAVTGDVKAHRAAEQTVMDLWDANKPIPAVETRYENVWLCRASDKLDEVDRDTLMAAITALTRLKTVAYDVVLIDTPPAVGPRQVAPQIVADVLVSPLEPDMLSTHGLSSLTRMLAAVVKMNSDIRRHVLINRSRKVAPEQQKIVEELRGALKDTLLLQELTEREFVRHARAHYRPVWLEAPREPAALAWRAMCDQVLWSVSGTGIAPLVLEDDDVATNRKMAEQEEVA
ncbi:MAG: ParA family protein [Acidithiobacillus ferrooxidans]|jgi:chromosome partitioning protein